MKGEAYTCIYVNINVRLFNDKAIEITGNRVFELNETTTIRCSTPVPVASIQWRNVSSGDIVSSPELSFLIVPSSRDAMYTCEISDGGFTESETITIRVGSKYPLVCAIVHAPVLD